MVHQFVYMPECLMPIMGRDLLSKLDAQITFKERQVKLLIPESKAVEARIFMLQNMQQKEEEILMEDGVIPLVWASEVPGRSKLADLVNIILKPGARPVRQNNILLSQRQEKV